MWKKKLIFWLMWIPSAPFVFMLYLIRDLLNGRYRHPLADIKTKLVYQLVREKIGIDGKDALHASKNGD